MTPHLNIPGLVTDLLTRLMHSSRGQALIIAVGLCVYFDDVEPLWRLGLGIGACVVFMVTRTITDWKDGPVPRAAFSDDQ